MLVLFALGYNLVAFAALKSHALAGGLMQAQFGQLYGLFAIETSPHLFCCRHYVSC
jgi:hypothetical protein